MTRVITYGTYDLLHQDHINLLHSKNIDNPRPQQAYPRQNWLDWMKAIGIVLIAYGHFFSLYDRYVYVFSVPLFFVISGFLCKRETDTKLFWKKLWYNLVVPLVIICTLNYLIGAIKWFLSDNNPHPANPLLFLWKMSIGLHEAVGGLWFVYTLIILKIILQFTPRASLHLLWFVAFCVLAYVHNHYDVSLFDLHPSYYVSSITDTFVSYPFFIIGYALRHWKDQISNYKPNKYTFCWIVISLLLVFLCGHHHQRVFLIVCGYGDNSLLFLLGGLAGSAFVYFLSKLLDNLRWPLVTDISLGTILILGFHGHFIKAYRSIFSTISPFDLLVSILIVLLFVPIIRLCQSYFPLIIGKYRVKKTQTL